MKTIIVYLENEPLAKLEINEKTDIRSLLKAGESFVENDNEYKVVLRVGKSKEISYHTLRNPKYRKCLIYHKMEEEGKLIYSKFKKEEYNTQCMKVSELRKVGYKDLEEWMNNANNLYVGRRGRIFITEKDSNGITQKRVFHYDDSKFGNPYKVEPGWTLERCLEMYDLYLKENDLLQYTDELRGKTLGCFCLQDSHEVDCHAKMLYNLVRLSS